MKETNPFKEGDEVILSLGSFFGKIGQEGMMRFVDGARYTISQVQGNYLILRGYEDFEGIHWECFRPSSDQDP